MAWMGFVLTGGAHPSPLAEERCYNNCVSHGGSCARCVKLAPDMQSHTLSRLQFAQGQ